MLRAWRKPETIVVNEWCWNAMAKHADIVLPCTTSLERNDIGFSPRDPYVVHMSKVADVAGDARDDYSIFGDIAKEMGVAEQFTEGKTADEWVEWIYEKTCGRTKPLGIDLPKYDELKKEGWYKNPQPERAVVMLEAFRDDPINKPLKTPSGKIEIYSDIRCI